VELSGSASLSAVNGSKKKRGKGKLNHLRQKFCLNLLIWGGVIDLKKQKRGGEERRPRGENMRGEKGGGKEVGSVAGKVGGNNQKVRPLASGKKKDQGSGS